MSLNYTDSSSNSWYIDSYGRIQVSKDSQSLYDNAGNLSLSIGSSSVNFSYVTETNTTNTHSVTGTNTSSKISVTRDTYIGNGFARYLESFTNTDTVAKTITISLYDNVYYDSSTKIKTTSSGDTTFTTADKWITVDNSYSTTKPSVTHIISGNNTSVSNAVYSIGGITTTYTLTLAAGQTKSFMHFYAPSSSTEDSTIIANNIANLSSSVYTAGLTSSQLGTIQNFNFNKTSTTTTTLADHEMNLTLIGSNAVDGKGNSKNNVITGNNAANKLDGLAGDDKLYGLAGNDTLNGGAGNDILDGGVGNDTMIGGLGNDVYYVDSISDIVTENANEGIDTVQSSVTYTLGANVENLTLTGTGKINGTGNTLNNILIGNSAANILTGGAGNDTYVIGAGDTVVEATNGGTDTVQSSITYTLGANVENLTLTGNGKINGTGNTLNNILIGNSAANILTGGAGNDTYVIGAGDTVVEATNGGTDTVQSSITYTLGANVENLTLTGTTNINGTGNTLNNIIKGNSGDNILDGKGGTDRLEGGAGNDTYIFNTGTTIVEAANAGIDTVLSSVNYTLGSNLENLTLTGNVATTGTGNALDNTIIGNGLNNILNGGDGNDTLRGGGGNDTLNGGNGNDILIGDNGYAEGQIATATTTINNQKVSLNISIPESATGSLSVTGNISSADFANKLNIVYIIDHSTSMNYSFNGTKNVGDLNGDSRTNTVLDAAIASFIKLNESISSSGLGNGINIALVPFGTTASLITSVHGNTLATMTENLKTILPIGSTDYTAALTTAKNYLSSLNNGGKNIVFFASDGEPNNTSYLSSVLPSLRALGGGTTIKAIGLGTGASKNTLDILDDGILNNSAQIVLNPEDLDTTLLDSSVLGLAEGAWIEIYKNNVLVDLIGSDRFEITPLGVQFKSESFALSSTGTDKITAKLVMADNNATMLSTSAPISIKTFVSNDTLNGGAGNDILDGGFGADNMYGGAGNDTYYVDNVGDKVYETTTATSGIDSGGRDLVISSISYTLGNFVEDLTLTGTANINGIGNNLNNIITGNTGNNIINGGAGNDTMIGGKGNDTYYVDSTLDIITEKLDEGIDTVITTLNTTLLGDSSYNSTSSYSSYYGSRLYNVENATLAGNATGNTLTGSDKDNKLTGNSATNTLYGGLGNDTLNGAGGADNMYGGAGNDTYYVDNAGDKVYETTTATSGIDSGGRDLVNSSISYTLGNFVEDLTLTGTANINGIGNNLNNIITGNTGNNIINGGAGNDTMIGGKGNDTYYVNSFLDKVIEKTNEGTDLVYSSIGYKLSSNVENLILTGNTNIAGSGNELANKIIGNSGSNYLFGYNGNDILNGKLGNDILVGGAGKDNFVFDTTLNASTNKDTIKDFNVADDTISLENAIFTKLTATGILNKDFFK
ncbi:VWA domain-containing protein, partial [Aliarcobacter butzleri]|uniref:beta strand repeat-containing protein n=1 Tax=Aliarcobacter butzleri TaxID=28197 RepID=UPI0021B239B2